MRIHNQFFHIHGIVTECSHGFSFCGFKSIFHLIFCKNPTHSFAAATGRGFQQNRISYRFSKRLCLFYTGNQFLRPRYNRNLICHHQFSGGLLITHILNDICRWSDKNNAVFFTLSGKISIFGQKTVSRMNGITFHAQSCFN